MRLLAKRLIALAAVGWLAVGEGALGSPSLPESHDYRLGGEGFAVTVRASLERWVEKVGARFDTTAAVVSVQREGREFLSGEGLADEFNPKWIAPPGYNDAKPGEPFLKIGIGNLLRTHDRRYLFGPHPVQTFAANRVLGTSATEAAFCQEFDSRLGWAYGYEKRYRVEVADGRLTIRYSLRNTGTKPMEIEQYNHNWMRLGNEPPGAGYSIESPFKLGPADPPLPKLDVSEGKIAFLESAMGPGYATAEQSTPAGQNRLVLRNARGGMCVEITGDFAVSRFSLFADKEGVCPEIFGHWILSPGQTVSWERVYRFGIEPTFTNQ